MKKTIISVSKHPLVSGSFVIFVGMMGANILNYAFNLGMGRFLSPGDYGVLISLISIFNIFSVFSTTINTVFTKFSAVFAGQKNEKLIGPLFVSGSLWVGILALIVSGIIVAFSSHIANFLHINSRLLVIITGISLFFSFLSFVGYGILQGLLRFGSYSFINIFSSFMKLLFGLIFILLDYKVFGAISALFLSMIVGYGLVLFPLSKYIKEGSPKKLSIHHVGKKIYLYAFPVFLSTVGGAVFITVDVILVKHFFSPLIAGQYAAISIMGRSIFYAISPISLVMFPLVAQKKERGENPAGLIWSAMALIGIPAILASVFYFIFPDLIRLIFFPHYEPTFINRYLGLFSIFIVLYTLSYTLNVLYLSLGKIKVYVFTILGALLEMNLIYFFHKDIGQVILGLVISSSLLLLSLLLYYPVALRDSKS